MSSSVFTVFGQAALTRRAFVGQAAAAAAMPACAWAAETPTPFAGFDTVVERAKALAEGSYQSPRMDLTGPFADLNYDAYRAIRVRPESRLWSGEESPFTVDLLPPGMIFHDAVRIHVVDDSGAREVPFDANTFDFHSTYFDEATAAAARATEGLAWSGFRLRFPINKPDIEDEIAVFQGASYFRAIGRGQLFGLSARALAVATATPGGEEFPVFKEFWLQSPAPNAGEVTVFGLLDSPSVAGACAFVIRPGAETTMTTTIALFPRRELTEVGLAPLTSMYWFGHRETVDDYRPAVHDSSGLQMVTGWGQRLWRPLANPTTLQVSQFVDRNPQGFGLAQRSRAFTHFQDAEARYDRRPSAWVEPLGDWGPGTVTLVEIPTGNEFNDNIVAFWQPEIPLLAGEEWRFSYRLYWGEQPPDGASLARVVDTREGATVNAPERRTIVVDFAFAEKAPEELRPVVRASAGSIDHVSVADLPGERDGVRVALDYRPPDANAAELSLALLDAEDALASETWMMRWTR